MIPFISCPEEANLETENRLAIARGWGQEGMGNDCLTGVGFIFGMRKIF